MPTWPKYFPLIHLLPILIFYELEIALFSPKRMFNLEFRSILITCRPNAYVNPKFNIAVQLKHQGPYSHQCVTYQSAQ